MRLLRRNNSGGFSHTKEFLGANPIPPYAILSHTWKDGHEVTFKDLIDGTGRSKAGYDKIRLCGLQAERDGLQCFWVDTCCIDKQNETELSRSINSMFLYYRNATRCYVYMVDVCSPSETDEIKPQQWEQDFRKSKWFTRGWTLQELLAPGSIDFYSRDWKRLGDKSSLRHQIHEISGIPYSALQGTALSHFSDSERFVWMECRQTKLAEDKAYALLGIFDVRIPLIYGEGAEGAFRRLQNELDKLNQCIKDLRSTSPHDDKKRIEEAKGGLLASSYHWILENPDFQQWRNNQQNRLLWIKGDPGKGKTMVLCGIIDELNKSIKRTALLSYFFCQATDSRINSATAVLRGLLYLLLTHQPSLVSHMQKKYDHAGKDLFEDANAWVALSEILASVLEDLNSRDTFIIIDALDECVQGLPMLLDFIVQTSSALPRVKWIVSSRNWLDIEEYLERASHKTKLSLELNSDSVSSAVGIFIRHKVVQLAKSKKYNDKIKTAVLHYLSHNADNTFLWVALVCQDLEKIPRWKTLTSLKAFPPGLDALYRQMMQQIHDSDDVDLCKRVLILIAIVYRPIALEELASLDEMLGDMLDDLESLQEVVSLCGSFLTVRQGTVYFVHQSAKDFIYTEATDRMIEDAHYVAFSRSLQIMSKSLHRDMYSLGALGFPIEQIKQPDPDPLAMLRYSCVYWIDHLSVLDLKYVASYAVIFQDEGSVDIFLRTKYLYWLEALSLCKSISKGVLSIAKLLGLVQGRSGANALTALIQDARRFIMSHKDAIMNSPLQTYTSALIFSPSNSQIKGLFKIEEPDWINIKPAIENTWSSCLQTLEGHCVAFSCDSAQLVSASWNQTVQIWDASSGECLQTLKGHIDHVSSVAFSHDSALVASASEDQTVKIWDASSGECLQTLEGHIDHVSSVAFSHNSALVASASEDQTVKIWDTISGKCLKTLESHSADVSSVAFSHDSTRVASASGDQKVKIWDTISGKCLETLNDHSADVSSVAFSHDSARIASGSWDQTVKIWNINGECLQTLEGHNEEVNSVAFSPDSARVVSASSDNTIKIWDASSGECLQTLKGHSLGVESVSFSHNSAQVASASSDNTVKIWDASVNECPQTLEGHSHYISSITFSHDTKLAASASWDKTVKIWDTNSGECLQTLEGHSNDVQLVAFSHNSARIASASDDQTVKIWDTGNGECLQTLKGHSKNIHSVGFSYDSAWVASAPTDQTVRIWNVHNGKCLQTLEGHSNDVYLLAFSHNSARIASASWDQTIKIWDTNSGKSLRTLNIGQRLYHMVFGLGDAHLHTDIGTIDISTSSLSIAPATISGPCNTNFENYTLSSDGKWIKYHSENLVWIPAEYRPTKAAVSGKMIAIGGGSGRVWIIKLEMAK